MSVAKITTVAKSAKDQKPCGKCGVELPKGSAYLWYKVGFRSRYKYVRCTKISCFPKPSERESSAKAGPMAAMEEFEAAQFSDIERMQSAWEDVQSAFREFADECESALDSWENGNLQLEERRDGAEAAAEEVEQHSIDDYDGDVDEETGEPEDEDEFDQFLADQHQNAIDAMQTAEGNWV